MSSSHVQFIGSRELHRDLPKVLEALDEADTRIVLTVHSRPRAVLIGAEAFATLLQTATAADQLLARQLGALVQAFNPADDATKLAGPRDQPGQL